MPANFVQLVYEQRERLGQGETWIERDIYADARHALEADNRVLVITGMRRVGKSTLLHQLMQPIKGYCYLNFEDERLLDFSVADFQQMHEALLEVYGPSNTYFFDEIQNVPKFEVVVRKLQDSGKKVVLTGSNASLLSMEFGTKLTGRYKQVELFPFSFREYLRWKQIQVEEKHLHLTDKRAELKAHFKVWLQQGGLPEYLLYNDPDYVRTLYDNILYRDIIVRYGIRNHKELKELVHLLVGQMGRPITYTSLQKHLGLSNSDTVKSYIGYLSNAYLFYELLQYFHSAKRQLRNPRKAYVIDPAFQRLVAFNTSEDWGRKLENAVFLQFRRTAREWYYFRDEGECDFVVRDKEGTFSAWQVCYELNEENTNREVAGLMEALDFFGLDRGTILTFDREDTLEEGGKTIDIVPVWKWMLQMA